MTAFLLDDLVWMLVGFYGGYAAMTLFLAVLMHPQEVHQHLKYVMTYGFVTGGIVGTIVIRLFISIVRLFV